MYCLFEDSGKLLAARVLSRSDASAQVELDSGRRLKVKTSAIVLDFESPEPAALLEQARAQADAVELDLAWTFAPEDEFSFAALAQEYFGAQASLAERAGLLLALQGAPHYFRRAGRGHFRKASAEVLAQALAAIEKRRAVEAQIAAWADELASGRCPDAVRSQIYRVLFKPDKNAPEYKAVVQAARATQLGPLALLMRAGAIASAYQFHWQRFLLEQFAQGTGFGRFDPPTPPTDLPLAAVQAFSIDDSATTEIDDALSLQGLGGPLITLGIHIAAPALAFTPGSALDALARTRLSTVYMPGHKLTMLPDDVVSAFTLQAGQACPAVSLYLDIDPDTLDVQAQRTCIERVPIAANLRHDQLDAWVSPDWLQNPDLQIENTPQALLDVRSALSFLYRLALAQKARREAVRGKPETFNRPDYNFKLIGMTGAAPSGDESVQISERRRGAPLDLIVAEAMILANSRWGAWLAELGVPALYRSQASLAPGVKVRMGTRALPHAGIGVSCYSWSTSPLRRYVDLVNQWQIVACVRHGTTAALAAPFKPKDAALLAILSAFDAAYTAYNDFQTRMERYWTLRHVQQSGQTELDASVLKDGLVRALHLPLVLAVPGLGGLPRGAAVRVRLAEIDLVALDVHATLLRRLDTQASPEAGEDDEDDAPMAGPIALALDVNDADSPPAAPAAP